MNQQTHTLPAPEAAGAHLAAQALGCTPGVPASLRYYVAGFTRATEGAYRDLVEAESALMQQHAAKNEEGQLVPRRDEAGEPIPNSFQFASPEAALAFRTELAELHATPVTITYTPIPMAPYFERLDEAGVEFPEGVLETLWPFFEHETAAAPAV